MKISRNLHLMLIYMWMSLQLCIATSYLKGSNEFLISGDDEVSGDKITSYQSLSNPGVEKIVQFYLYTSNERITLILNNSDALKASPFNSSRPCKLLIHGYRSKNILHDIITAYLVYDLFNVLLVDWTDWAKSTQYWKSASMVPVVGLHVARFIEFLVHSGGIDVKSIHVIGHSLGAHIAGIAGNTISRDVGNLSRISGLDPAMPLFRKKLKSERLSEESAVFVDCIHTSGGRLGFEEPICTVDFYPNGGKPIQPGWKCSHTRAHELYAESIEKRHLFVAQYCNSLKEKDKEKCDVSIVAFMGEPADKSCMTKLVTLGTVIL